MATLEERVSSLERGLINDFAEPFKAVMLKLDEIIGVVSSHDEDIHEDKVRLAIIEARLGSIDGRLNRVDEKLGKMNVDINGMKNHINGIKADNSGMKNHINGMKADISKILALLTQGGQAGK